MNTSYIVIVILFVVLFLQHRNKQNWVQQYIQRKKRKDNTEMLELAKRFIEKEWLF